MKHRQIKGKRPRGKTGLVRMKERGARKIKKNKERQGRGKDRDKGQTGGLRLQSLYDVMLEEVSYKTQLRPLSLSHTHIHTLTHTRHLRVLLIVGSILQCCISVLTHHYTAIIAINVTHLL